MFFPLQPRCERSRDYLFFDDVFQGDSIVIKFDETRFLSFIVSDDVLNPLSPFNSESFFHDSGVGVFPITDELYNLAEPIE